MERDEGLVDGLHPALLGCVLRGERVGHKEMAATLVRLAVVGAVDVRIVPAKRRRLGINGRRLTAEVCVRPSVLASQRPQSGTPLIRQGRIEGLSKVDRALLSLVFDHVAHDRRATLEQVADFAAADGYAYWSQVYAWRELVVAETRAKGLLDRERRAGIRQTLHHKRALLSASMSGASGPTTFLASRDLELAVVLGVDHGRARALGFPRSRWRDVSPSAGLQRIWQLRGLDAMDRLP